MPNKFISNSELKKLLDLTTLTGTAGLMILAKLDWFVTYTFLTSAMSIISMGTLGLDILYSLGKPKLSKTIPIVATVGAIRQRVLYKK